MQNHPPFRRAGLLGCHYGCATRGEATTNNPVASLPLRSLGRYGLLRATIRGLRLHAPTAVPVVVRSGNNMPLNTDAYCIRRQNRFVIMLGQHLNPRSAVEACIHEWAHARAWNHLHDRACANLAAGVISEQDFEELVHDGTWGVAFADCWRVFTGKVLPDYDPATA